MITVEDNGVGLAAKDRENLESRRDGGIGLANLRARLEALYGENQKVELAARPGGGLAVQIEIPWHRVPRADAAKPVES